LKEPSDGETLIAVGMFQICGAVEEKARHPKSVFNFLSWKHAGGRMK